MNQKERSKQYSHLVGKNIRVYRGQVPSTAKCNVYEYSLFPMSNIYGDYVEIRATIKKTNFNGNMITLDLQHIDKKHFTKIFNITENDVNDIVELEDNVNGLISIWGDLKAGDLVLFQHMSEWTVEKGYSKITKPTLAVIVGVDIWDMAVAVYYTQYKDFDAFKKDGIKCDATPEIKSFGEWGEYWNVLGHWNTMPNLSELMKAYRKAY